MINRGTARILATGAMSTDHSLTEQIFYGVVTAGFFASPDQFNGRTLPQLSELVRSSAVDSLASEFPSRPGLINQSCKYLAAFLCDVAHLNGYRHARIIQGTIKCRVAGSPLQITHHWVFDRETGLSHDAMVRPGEPFRAASCHAYRPERELPISGALFGHEVMALEGISPWFDFSAFADR